MSKIIMDGEAYGADECSIIDAGWRKSKHKMF